MENFESWHVQWEASLFFNKSACKEEKTCKQLNIKVCIICQKYQKAENSLDNTLAYHCMRHLDIVYGVFYLRLFLRVQKFLDMKTGMDPIICVGRSCACVNCFNCTSNFLY